MRRVATVGLLLAAAACESEADGPQPTIDAVAGTAATVVAVLDGDSLAVEIGGAEEEVRLLGLNTPERHECFGAEARSRTEELVADRVRLQEGGEGRDQFGRLLRYVHLLDGTDLGSTLLAEGKALSISTDHQRRDAYKEAEAEAFAQKAGLWAADACGPAAVGAIEIVDVLYDPPGPDDEVPNEEWVELRNAGPDRAELAGWTVRDESSRHRHRFPAATGLAPGDILRLRSGCGDDSAGEVHWCAGGSVWSNGGDTAYLLDPAGNVVDRFGY